MLYQCTLSPSLSRARPQHRDGGSPVHARVEIISFQAKAPLKFPWRLPLQLLQFLESARAMFQTNARLGGLLPLLRCLPCALLVLRVLCTCAAYHDTDCVLQPFNLSALLQVQRPLNLALPCHLPGPPCLR